MISHTKKFVLISPPKTASVSLINALKHMIDIKQIIPQIEGCYDYIESSDNVPAKHKTAENYKKYITDYYVAGCVRNPFDRLVSWWKWAPKWDDRYIGMSFEGFLTRVLVLRNDGKTLLRPEFLPQFDYFSINGVIAVDTIIRFENIQQDFNMFCTNVGIEPISLQVTNSSKRDCYTKYYNDTTYNIIKKIYKKDIEYFGYKFEEQNK